MTTYNGAKFVAQQLDSIIDQTIKDFELIICDDCSTDNTLDIISKYASDDSRIKIIRNQNNLGFKKNFEQALRFCTGDFIALCDQDDIWEENHLELLISNIGNNYVIAGNNQLVDADMKSLSSDFFSSHLFSLEKYPDNSDILKKILLSGNCFQGASMLLKRDFLKFYLPLPEDIPYHDSWLAALACSFNKFTCINTIITKYRQHDNQVTHNDKSNKGFAEKRVLFCNELLYRNPEIDNPIKIFITKSKIYFSNVIDFKQKVSQLKFWNKNYTYLYPDKNRTKKIIRLIKFLMISQV